MKHTLLILLFASVGLLTECDPSAKLIEDQAAYIASVKQWQQDRIESLKSKDGWVNLAGIYWLKEGSQTFGSDPGNDIVFPAKAPAFIGSLTLKGERVHLQVKDGIEVYLEGKAVKEMDLSYHSSGKPSYLQHGDFAWYIMKRHKSLAVRLRDYKNPAIEALDHIPSYPINTAFVVEARLKPFDKPRIITVNTPFLDYTQDYSCPGELHFKLKGGKLTLLPFESGERYFLIFSDETSALDTYGGGRFMYTRPDSTGRILLDFNKAYNPPCALTPFAACPMPLRENHLPVKVEAGEKVVAKH
jgi:uncharacterized protein (DUF1684 family)